MKRSHGDRGGDLRRRRKNGFRGRPGGEEARRRREECKNESEE
jgi:hypothetical protein